jgi:DNA-binding NarL/FixJ family response regulator
VISAYDTQSVIQDSLRYGASGFIPKHLGMDDIAEAINIVLQGDVWCPGLDDMQNSGAQRAADHADFSELTATQIKVLSLLRDGKPSKEMADILLVTEATVKAHLTEIYRKLNVRNRTQAVLLAKELELPEA